MTGSSLDSDPFSSPLDLDGREMSLDAWKRMRRRPGFKYEYHSGRARISVQKGAAPFALARLEDVIETASGAELPSNLSIRPAASVSPTRLIEAWVEGFRGRPDYHRYDEEALRRSAAQEVQSLVGSNGAEAKPESDPASRVAIGAGVAGALFLSKAKTRPWIEVVFVRPDIRRRGVASRLLCEAARRLRASGEKLIVSSYLLANQASARWHEALGFVEIPDWLTCRHRYATLYHNWKAGRVDDSFAARRHLRILADTVRELRSKHLSASKAETPHSWLSERGDRFDAFAAQYLPPPPVKTPLQLGM